MKNASLLVIALAACSSAAFAQHTMAGSRYGGPSYTGAPALTVTASLIRAGGGPAKFSAGKALNAIAGPKLAKAELAKLTKQYGAKRIGTWVAIFDFAVKDAVKRATAAKVKLPKGNLKGAALGAALVGAGLDKNGTFYVEFMLDKALSHTIHMQVMDDIDAKFGEPADADFHRITNQAMVDLAHALGKKDVKLPNFH
jgi:hypothetical protein